MRHKISLSIVLFSEFKFEENGSPLNGFIRVSVGGVEGRVCAGGWTDMEANVLCKSRGYV